MKTIGLPIIQTLADICADLLTFAAQLRKTKDPGDPEAFRLKVDELFKAFETRARQTELGDANIQLAKYAIAAFIDEQILNSTWPLKDSWSGRPLQLEYFNDFSAGEEFYTKLDTLRNTGDAKKLEVLEVYYLCLALGFKGKYADLQGLEKLKGILDGISKELRSVRAKGAEGLSPNWKPADDMNRAVKNFPAWIFAVAGLAWLFFLYVLLRFLLSSLTSDTQKTIG